MSFALQSAAFATALALMVSGCGGGSARTAGPAAPATTSTATTPPARTTAATTPTATTTTPAPATTPNRESAPGGAGDEQGVRVPATFTFRRGRVASPAQISVPAFLAVELTIVARDGRAHTVTIDAGGRRYSLSAPAGGRAAVRIPGLRGGAYPLLNGAGQVVGTLVVGGEPGP